MLDARRHWPKPFCEVKDSSVIEEVSLSFLKSQLDLIAAQSKVRFERMD